MIYLFHGTDRYQTWVDSRKQAAKLAKQSGLEVLPLEADEIDINQLLNHITAVSLFNNKSLVLLKRLFDSAALARQFETILDTFKDVDIVIWQPGKADKRTTLYKSIAKQGQVVEHTQPKFRDLVSWVSKTAKQKKLQLPSRLAELIIERVGEDKFRLEQELEKLVRLSEAELPEAEKVEPSEVSEDLILDSVGVSTTGDVWTFLDALASGNRKKALLEYDKMMRFEPNTQYIIAMLARELWLMSQVLNAQEKGIPLNTLGMAPFVLTKTQKKLRRYSWQRIQKLSQGLLRLDYAIKQGAVPEYEAMLMYILIW